MTNMFGRVQAGAMALAALLAASLIVSPTVAAEIRTVNAHAAYTGEGKIYKTGENKGMFVGALVGELMVEGENGPLHAGRIVCPGMVALDLKNGNLAGNGRCTVTAEDGAAIFAVWSCRGMLMIGCDGMMMLTGGTGRTAGVSGSGPMTIRTTSQLLTKDASNKDSITHLGRGVLILRGFKYNQPSK